MQNVSISRQTGSVLHRASLATILGEVRFDKKGDATIPFLKMHMWKGGQLVLAP